MADNYEVTCAHPGCGAVTFSGTQPGAVEAALEAHVEAFHNYMTGQEWYERFEKEMLAELNKPMPEGLGIFPERETKDLFIAMGIEAAARKASGLE